VTPGPAHARSASPAGRRRPWWRRSQRRVLFALAGGLGAAAVLLLAGSRHRVSDLGRAPSGRAPATARTAGTVAEPSRPALDGPPTATSSGALVPDATGRIRVPLSDVMPRRLPVEGVPEGWRVKEFFGHAQVALVRDEGQAALRLTSDHASFALYRDVVVDLDATPRLTWSWKAARLPRDGDVRVRAMDDEAAQVYVIFPRWPSPLTHSDVIGYVWDSHAPVGTRVTSPKAGNVRVIVLQSGPDRSARWRREERDVAADYRALFGRTPPWVGKIAVMTDSNDTRAEAEALFGELSFLPPR
jgi:DUF3047 family protein